MVCIDETQIRKKPARCWLFYMVEGDGFEPSKAEPADLQSAPFGHSGTPPEFCSCLNQIKNDSNMLNMVEGDGFEPSKAEPADLQSAPFGHSGTPPGYALYIEEIFPTHLFGAGRIIANLCSL